MYYIYKMQWYLILGIIIVGLFSIMVIYQTFTSNFIGTQQRFITMICLLAGLVVFGYITYILSIPVDSSTVSGGTPIVNTTQQATIPASITTIPNNPQSNAQPLNYTFSIWVYINDWNIGYGEDKLVLKAPTIAITLGKQTPEIIVISNGNQPCNAGNIPLQKWVNVTSVVHSNNIDTYINGRLRAACILNTVPMLLDKSPNQPFGGLIGRSVVWPRALIPSEVLAIYNAGYSGNSYLSSVSNATYTITSNNAYSPTTCKK